MGWEKTPIALVLVTGIAVLAGCASVVPEQLQEQVDRQVQFSDLQPDPTRYAGRMVVLGGRIAAFESSDGFTELEVTELPLAEEREIPRLSAESSGRFLVAHHGTLDPKLYRTGRPITIVGVVLGARTLPGENVPKPVIDSEYIHLWPDLSTRRRVGPPPLSRFSSDPFDPWESSFRPFSRRFPLFRRGFGF